jgi:hypothetical protein
MKHAIGWEMLNGRRGAVGVAGDRAAFGGVVEVEGDRNSAGGGSNWIGRVPGLVLSACTLSIARSQGGGRR